jgi:hypothetical protein
MEDKDEAAFAQMANLHLRAILVTMKRFLLSWLTYVPGLAVGAWVIIKGDILGLGVIGLIVGGLELILWIFLSSKQLDKDELKKLERELETDAA